MTCAQGALSLSQEPKGGYAESALTLIRKQAVSAQVAGIIKEKKKESTGNVNSALRRMRVEYIVIIVFKATQMKSLETAETASQTTLLPRGNAGNASSLKSPEPVDSANRNLLTKGLTTVARVVAIYVSNANQVKGNQEKALVQSVLVYSTRVLDAKPAEFTD